MSKCVERVGRKETMESQEIQIILKVSNGVCVTYIYIYVATCNNIRGAREDSEQVIKWLKKTRKIRITLLLVIIIEYMLFYHYNFLCVFVIMLH